MLGLMQNVRLTIDLLLRRCLELGAEVEVVSALQSGVDRRSWRSVGERALRLCNVLERLGVPRGARVGTFAWGTHRHLELFFAAPVSGRVVHALNVRLTGEQIAELVAHAADDVLFVDASLTGLLAPLKGRLASVREYVIMEDGGAVDPAFADCPRYEALLAHESSEYALPALDEQDAAWLCYTSGTTGKPKGVLASQRSVVLHAMAQMMRDAHAVSRADSLLLGTQLFHLAGWGLPYAAALAAGKLVLAGRDTTPLALAQLIARERVTVAAVVPAIWVQIEPLLDRSPPFDAPGTQRPDLSSLRAVISGGSPISRSLIARAARHGLEFFQAWGMTEAMTGTTVRYLPDASADDGYAAAPVGLPIAGNEIRIVDEQGAPLPWDGTAVGELQVRGPWVIRAYYEPEDDANTRCFQDGFLRTGDLARVSPNGSVQLVDRLKDLIKSGGEWISSLELERAVLAFPGVVEVAVAAMPHPRWGERPAALVVLAPGVTLDFEQLRSFLSERVAKWWLPDHIEVAPEIPKTATGKPDKRALREHFAREVDSRAPGAEQTGTTHE
jgi:fatty-acyl-CoA synthase